MTQKYDPKSIEAKWQKYWERSETFHVTEDKSKEKFYSLIEFPYPSGAGLHVGHARPFTAMDVVSRKKRMDGYNVLYPIGFDAFGLPTENYAIKTGRPPAEVTAENIATFTRQLKALGYSFDWSRVVDTTDPQYFKWTQWLFLQFYKHGLAYKKNMPINWCLSCKIGLANEEVVDGKCERCGGPVEKRDKEQWMLAITKYADSLIEGLKDVDYIPQARIQQENWIGRSDGASVKFQIADFKLQIEVFTTRPDTLFGATYMVLAPEHPLIADLKFQISNFDEVEKYIEQAKLKSDLERTELQKEKTGVELKGIKAINPANKEEIPVFVADYVLASYGTGAIMAVPAHDERDFEFAKKFDVPIKKVVDKQKYFIFDFDGVLGDTFEANLRARVRVGVASNIDEARKSALEYSNNKPNHTKDHELSDEELKNTMELWTSKFGTEMLQEKFDLFHEFIDEILKIENAYIAVVSSGSELYIKPALEKTKLKPSHILTLEDHHSKEEKIQTICRDWGVPKDEVYYFTDSKADVYELENMLPKGHIIGCSWGYCTKEDLEDVLPREYILENYDDIHHLFDTLHVGEGFLINSEDFDGLHNGDAKEKMIEWLEENGVGKRKTQYKLRDWVFSRQRYWGEPIPLVHCDACENKKQDVFVFHGWEDTSESGFIPKFRQNLESKGYNTYAFDAPNTQDPHFEEWFAFAESQIKDQDTENITLVGHSMGGHVILKLAEKYRFKRLVLVAPVGFNPSDEYFAQFKGKLGDEEISIFRNYQNHDLDVEAVKENVGQIDFIFGEKDPWITSEIVEYYKANFPAATFEVIKDAKHFADSEGVRELLPLEEKFCVWNGWIPLPEDQLPLTLPHVEKYEPTDTGESPLAAIEDWVNTTCPECGGSATRETDTMPNWAGSSWYFLRYMDPHNDEAFASKEALEYWAPVDWYNGGMEHTVLHLLYSRFWNQFLFDIGLVPTKEPYAKRTSHGMILAEDGEKMSKSRGNVINPDDMIEKFGTDAFRTYIMFMGPFDQAVAWDTNGVVGVRRFLDRVWNLRDRLIDEVEIGKLKLETGELDKETHKTIKKVGEDIENMAFNTAVAKLMELVNVFSKYDKVPVTNYQLLVTLLSPFAPHLAEELWSELGHNTSITYEPWPTYDESKLVDDTVTLAVQVNGKVRAEITVATDTSEDDVKKLALEQENVIKWIEGKEPKKVIYVKGRLVSVVV